jgi:hypothetical protein
MPSIRSIASEHSMLFTISISLNGEIMSLCSYYTKKGLVYIVLVFPFRYQPFSYLEYTKVNT